VPYCVIVLIDITLMIKDVEYLFGHLYIILGEMCTQFPSLFLNLLDKHTLFTDLLHVVLTKHNRKYN
jgi:hypothetical protein